MLIKIQGVTIKITTVIIILQVPIRLKNPNQQWLKSIYHLQAVAVILIIHLILKIKPPIRLLILLN